MKHGKAGKLAVATIAAWWLQNVVVPTSAFHYSRAAWRDERNGFYYAAAIEWRHAAELVTPNTRIAEYCWSQWERIMRLPRRLAGSIDGSIITGIAFKSTSKMRPEVNDIPVASATDERGSRPPSNHWYEHTLPAGFTFGL